jgi:hydrogenase/urease accessory protein HupE
VRAQEVRRASLEIIEGADGRIDVLWKQPSQGLLVVPLRPEIEGRLLARGPDSVGTATNFEVHRWEGIDPGAKGLDGRKVSIAGLDQTITDALLLVRFKNGDQVQQILTPDAPGLVIDVRAGAAVSAYLLLGIEHILTGIDHLLFVLGLLLLSSGWRQLVKTVTAFTLSHSITLALSAVGIIALKPALVEALVALSIVFLAVELVRKQRGRSGPTQRKPWLVAFGFGLLHGAAFASALKDIGLPEGNIPASLVLFNAGVEIGQVLFVGAVLGLIALIGRVRLPARAPQIAWTATTYAIGAFSVFWFFERFHAAVLLA